MPVSQNGYSVVKRDDCKFHDDIVDGLSLPLRDDECGYLLARFAKRFHNTVEPLGVTDTFGHSERKIGNSDEWSNHASGTAIDLNASQHPQGKVGTYSVGQVFLIREMLRDFDEVIKWGGDYRTTKDEMHFEIDKPFADVKLLAQVLRRKRLVRVEALVPGKTNLDVYMVKRELSKAGLFAGELNKRFDKHLKIAYAAWQRRLGYEGDDADGVPGPYSLQQLGLKVKEG